MVVENRARHHNSSRRCRIVLCYLAAYAVVAFAQERQIDFSVAYWFRCVFLFSKFRISRDDRSFVHCIRLVRFDSHASISLRIPFIQRAKKERLCLGSTTVVVVAVIAAYQQFRIFFYILLPMWLT